MKLHLPKSLRAALLACVSVLTPVATTVSTGALVASGLTYTMLVASQAEANVLYFTGDSSKANIYNLTAESYASDANLQADDNTLIFTSAANVAAATGLNESDFGSSDYVTINMYGFDLSKLYVDASVAGSYSMVAGSGGTGRWWYLHEDSDLGYTYFDIDANFTIDLSPCTNTTSLYSSLQMYADLVIDVATDCTLTVASQFAYVGTADSSTITIGGGGTVVYENIDASSTDTSTTSNWVIKEGSTLDLSQDVGSGSTTTFSVDRLAKTLGSGSVTLNSGNLVVLDGSTIANDIIIQGADNSISASGGDIAVTGSVTLDDDASLSLDSGTLTIGDMSLTGADGAYISGGSISSTGSVSGYMTFSAVTIAGSDLVIESGATVKTISGCTVSDASFILNGGTFSSGGTIVPALTINADGSCIESWSTTGTFKLDSTLTFANDYSVELVNYNTDGTVSLGDSFDIVLGDYTLAGGTFVIFTGDVDATLVDALNAGEYVTDATWVLSEDGDSISIVYSSTEGELVWSGGDGNWDTSSLTWNDDSTAFTNDSSVRIDGTADTTDIALEQASSVASMSLVTSNGTSISLTGSGYSIDVAGELLKTGSGTASVGLSTKTDTLNLTGGELIFSGGLTVSTSANVSSGATLTFADDATIAAWDSSIAGTVKVTDSATVTVNGGASSDAVTGDLTRDVDSGEVGITRTTTGFDVVVEAGSTLSDGTKLALSSGATLNVSGEGTYKLQQLVLSASASATTYLNIAEGATLSITGTNADPSDGAFYTSFCLANWSATNEITVDGTLKIADIMYVKAGNAVMAVGATGTFDSAKGLDAGAITSGTITMNVSGRLLLGESELGAAASNLTVNMLSGATIEANADDITIYNSLTIEDAATLNLLVDSGETMSFTEGLNISGGEINVSGGGTVVLASTGTGSQTWNIGSSTILDASAGSVGLGTGTVNIDGGTLSLADGASLSNAVSIGSNGGTISSTSNLSFAGTLTVSGELTMTSDITLTGGLSVTDGASFVSNDNSLILDGSLDASSTLTLSGANVVLGGNLVISLGSITEGQTIDALYATSIDGLTSGFTVDFDGEGLYVTWNSVLDEFTGLYTLQGTVITSSTLTWGSTTEGGAWEDSNWSGGASMSDGAAIVFGSKGSTTGGIAMATTISNDYEIASLTVYGSQSWSISSTNDSTLTSSTGGIDMNSTGKLTVNVDIKSLNGVTVNAGSVIFTGDVEGVLGDITVASGTSLDLVNFGSAGLITVDGTMTTTGTNTITSTGAILAPSAGSSVSFAAGIESVDSTLVNFRLADTTTDYAVSAQVANGGSISFADGGTMAGGVLMQGGTISFNSSTSSTYTIESGIYFDRVQSSSLANSIIVDDNTSVIANGGAGADEGLYTNYTINGINVTLGANSVLSDNVTLWHSNSAGVSITGDEGVTNANAGTYSVTNFRQGYTDSSNHPTQTIDIGVGAIFEVTGTADGATSGSFILSGLSGIVSTVTIDGKLIINSGVSTLAVAYINVNSGGTIQLNAGAYSSTGSGVYLTMNTGSTLVLGNQSTATTSTFTINVADGVTLKGNGDTEVNMSTALTVADGATLNIDAGTGETLNFNAGLSITNGTASVTGGGTVSVASGSTTWKLADGSTLDLSSNTTGAATTNISVASSGAGLISSGVSLGGTLSLAGALTVTGDLTISGTLSSDSNGSINTQGATLTLSGALDMTSGTLSETEAYFDMSGSDVLLATGLTLDLDINTLTSGDTIAILSADTITAADGLIILSDLEGWAISWEITDGVLYATLSNADSLVWVGGSGVWTDSGAWLSDGTASDWDDGSTVIINGNSSGTSEDYEITLSGTISTTSLSVTGEDNWTLTGEDGSSLSVANKFTKEGTGTLTIDADLSNVVELSVKEGSVVLVEDNTSKFAKVSVDSGATLTANGTISAISLGLDISGTVNINGAVSAELPSITVNSGGALTLGANADLTGITVLNTAGTTILDGTIDNLGELNVTAGSLTANATLTGTVGAINVADGATASFAGFGSNGTGDITAYGDITVTGASESVGALIVDGGSISLDAAVGSIDTTSYTMSLAGTSTSVTVFGQVTNGGSISLGDGMELASGVYLDGGTITFNSADTEAGSTYSLSGIYIDRYTFNENTIIVGDNTTVAVSADSTFNEYILSDLTVQLGAEASLSNNVNLWMGAGTLTVEGLDGVDNGEAGYYSVASFRAGYTGYNGDSVTIDINEGAIFEVLGSVQFTAHNDSQLTTMNISGTFIANASITTAYAGTIINVNDGGTLQMNVGLNTSANATTLTLATGSSLVLGNLADGTTLNADLTTNVATGVTIADNGVDDTTVVSNVFTIADNATLNLAASAGKTLQMASDLNSTGLSLNLNGEGTVEFTGALSAGITVSRGTLKAGADQAFGSVSLASGATLDATAAGVSVGSLSIVDGSVLSIATTGAGLDLTGATFSADGLLTLNLDSSLASGTDCIIFAGVTSDQLADWNLDTIISESGDTVYGVLASTVLTAGDNWTMSEDYYVYINADGDLVLTDSLVAGAVVWNGGDSGAWSDGGAGWTGGNDAFDNGESVTFGSTGAGTVAVDAAGVQVNSMTVEAGSYTFTGGTVSVAGSLSVSSTVTFSSALSLAETSDITVVGNSASLTLNAQSGTTVIDDFSNAGTFSSNEGLTVNGDFSNTGTITLTDKDLTIAGTADTVSAGSTIIAANVTVTAGGISLGGKSNITGNVTVTAGGISLEGGATIAGKLTADSLVIEGDVSIGSLSDLDSLSNGQGALNMTETGGSFTVDSLENDGYLKLGDNDLTLTSGTDNAGYITAGDLTLTLNALQTVTATYLDVDKLTVTNGTFVIKLDASMGASTIDVLAGDGSFLTYNDVTIGSVESELKNFKISASTAKVTLKDDLSVSGEFNNNGGTMDMAGYDLVVGSTATTTAGLLYAANVTVGGELSVEGGSKITGALSATALLAATTSSKDISIGSLAADAMNYTSLQNNFGTLVIDGSSDSTLVVSGDFSNQGTIGMNGYSLELQSGTTTGGDLSAASLTLGADGTFGALTLTGALSAAGDLTADSLSSVTALSVAGTLDVDSTVTVTGADDVTVGALAITGDLTLSSSSLLMKTAEGATATASSITGGLTVGGDITTNAALDVTGDIAMGGSSLTLGGALTANTLSLTSTTATALSLSFDYQLAANAIDVTTLDLGSIDTLNISIEDDYLTGLGLVEGVAFNLIATDNTLSEDLTLALNGESNVYTIGSAQVTISVDGTNIILSYAIAGDTYVSDTGNLSDYEGANDGTSSIKFAGDGNADITVGDDMDVHTLYFNDDSSDATEYTIAGESIKATELDVVQGSLSIGNEVKAETVVIGSSVAAQNATVEVAKDASLDAEKMTITAAGNGVEGSFTNNGTTTVDTLTTTDGAILVNASSLTFGSESNIDSLSTEAGSTTTVAEGSNNVSIGEFDNNGQLIIAENATATLGADVSGLVSASNLSIQSNATLNIASGATLSLSETDTNFSNDGKIVADTVEANAYGAVAGDMEVNTLYVGDLTTFSTVKVNNVIFTDLVVSNPNAGIATTAMDSIVVTPDAGAEFLLQADQIVSDASLISLDLSPVLVTGVATGDYYLIENTTNDISWDSFELTDATNTAILDLFNNDGKDVLQATTADGDLVLVIADSDGYTWTIGDTNAASAGGLVMTGDVMSNGELRSYDALDGVSNVQMAEGDNSIDLTNLSKDAADASDSLLISNLSNAGTDGTYKLTITGDGIDDDAVTLSNDKVTSAGNVTADGVTVNVTSITKDITLSDGSTATTTGSLTLASLTLTDSALAVASAANLTVNSLTMDADSSLTGALSLTQGESELLGTITNATITMSNGATATVDMDNATNLALVTSGSTVNLSNATANALGSITASQGTTLNLGTLDSTMDLVNSSSITGSTVNLDVTSSMLGSSTDLFNVMEYQGTLTLSNTTIAIGLDGSLDGASLSGTNGVYTLFNLGDAVEIDSSSSIELTGVLASYFTGVSVVNGSVVATRNDSTYNAMGLTENGKAGLNLVSKALAATDLSDLLSSASTVATVATTTTATTATGDLMDVYTDMNSYMASGATRAADTLAAAVAGATTTSLGSAMMADVERQLRTTRNRTRSMGVDPTVVNPDMPYYNAWIAAEGSSSKLDSDSTYAGHTLSNTGGAVGVDVDLNDVWSVGASFTALIGDLDSDGADTAKGDFDTMYASVYARANKGRWNHSFVASYGMLDATLDRTVRGTDTAYTSKGDTSGNAFALMYEVGYTYAVTEDASTCIQPVFSVSMVNSNVDGYTEKGSDATLKVGDQKNTYVTFGVGGVIETIVGEDIYNRASVFSGRVMLKADAGERTSEADVTLTSNSGVTETVKGADVGAIGLELGVGITIPVTEDVGAIFIDASCDLRSGMTSFSGTVGYRFSF